MPNWCHNTLEVRGPKGAVASFQRSSNKDGYLSFAASYPEPSDAETDEGYDWYSWRTENWGTKWDLAEDCPAFSDIIDDSSHGSVCCYRFETAWSPPCGWLGAVSSVFPELEFSLQYAEVGNDFAGRYTVSAGRILEDVSLPVEKILTREEDRWF